MVTKLLIVWFLGVVAFFVLWALLAKVVRRISEKREQKDEPTSDDSEPLPKD